MIGRLSMRGLPPDVVFTSNGHELLRLKANGDILIPRRDEEGNHRSEMKIGTDAEIVEGLRLVVALNEVEIAKRLHATDPRVVAFIEARGGDVSIGKVWDRDEGGWASEAKARAAQMVRM